MRSQTIHAPQTPSGPRSLPRPTMDQTPQSSAPSARASPRMPREKLLKLGVKSQNLGFQKHQLPCKNLESVRNLDRLFSTRIRLTLLRTHKRRNGQNRVPDRPLLDHIDLVLR